MMSYQFPCHTAYHSNFFVLRLDVRLNRLPVKLNTSPDGQLELCGQPTESHAVLHLPMEAVARTVQECLSSHGHGIVNRVMYGDDAPLFQVDTGQSFDVLSLKSLIARLPGIDQKLKSEFEVSVSTGVAQPISCMVISQLFLMCPDKAKNDIALLAVNIDNAVQCIELWQKSFISDFSQVFKVVPVVHEISLKRLVKELQGVVRWFYFGVQLGIPDYELKKIERDFSSVEECKMNMLSMWLNMKEGSWLDVVGALVNMGMKSLAKRIAKKYGVPLAEPSNHNSIVSQVSVENGNKSSSELASRIKQLEKEAVAHEEKLAAKDEEITHLRTGLRRKQNIASSIRERALLFENEAKNVERERGQLQSKAEQMHSEIVDLKKQQMAQAQAFSEVCKQREDLQIMIEEKEKELSKASHMLEEKDKELVEQKMEAERMGMRLKEAEEELVEKNNEITKLNEEVANLQLVLCSVTRHLDTLLREEVTLCLEPQTKTASDDSVDRELPDLEEKVGNSTVELAEKDRETLDLSQQIKHLEPQGNKEKGVDMSLQQQISESHEMRNERDAEREAVDAQLVTSSTAVETLENISDVLGENMPTPLPAQSTASSQRLTDTDKTLQLVPPIQQPRESKEESRNAEQRVRNERDAEREAVDAQLITSSTAAETLENISDVLGENMPTSLPAQSTASSRPLPEADKTLQLVPPIQQPRESKEKSRNAEQHVRNERNTEREAVDAQLVTSSTAPETLQNISLVAQSTASSRRLTHTDKTLQIELPIQQPRESKEESRNAEQRVTKITQHWRNCLQYRTRSSHTDHFKHRYSLRECSQTPPQGKRTVRPRVVQRHSSLTECKKPDLTPQHTLPKVLQWCNKGSSEGEAEPTTQRRLPTELYNCSPVPPSQPSRNPAENQTDAALPPSCKAQPPIHVQVHQRCRRSWRKVTKAVAGKFHYVGSWYKRRPPSQ